MPQALLDELSQRPTKAIPEKDRRRIIERIRGPSSEPRPFGVEKRPPAPRKPREPLLDRNHPEQDGISIPIELVMGVPVVTGRSSRGVVRAEIGGRRLTIKAGVLPPTLQMMFGLLLGPDGWIVGSDFFRGRKIEIDYARERFIDIQS
ncbi:MAG: hypothetical protein ACR2GK_01455 [Gemmatimonadaceae bacterium]